MGFLDIYVKRRAAVVRYAWEKFFAWYEKYTEQNILIATVLFFTQILHLIWLALFVIAERLSGDPIWVPNDLFEHLIIFFDYLEIPALIAATLLYISLIRANKQVKKAWLYIVFINLQYLHIFWITDEFVVDTFSGAETNTTILPAWLAWVAILVDYLELPVIYDTSRRSIKIIKAKIKKTA